MVFSVSAAQYNKVIWQCVTSTKKGKKFCPDSKGIAEETIEQAFYVAAENVAHDLRFFLIDSDCLVLRVVIIPQAALEADQFATLHFHFQAPRKFLKRHRRF